MPEIPFAYLLCGARVQPLEIMRFRYFISPFNAWYDAAECEYNYGDGLWHSESAAGNVTGDGAYLYDRYYNNGYV